MGKSVSTVGREGSIFLYTQEKKKCYNEKNVIFKILIKKQELGLVVQT